MRPTLILYGSTARGDARPNSDVDLLLALDTEALEEPSSTKRVSVHRYPKAWLERKAKDGSLFVYHIAHEGLALDDPSDFLLELRAACVLKPSYNEELMTAGLVVKLLTENDWGFNYHAQRRFFWALRTILVTASTRIGAPIYSTDLLERTLGPPGLSELLERRESASFEQCRRVADKIISGFLPNHLLDVEGESLRSILMERGGIARDSVRVVEEGEAISDIGLHLYG